MNKKKSNIFAGYLLVLSIIMIIGSISIRILVKNPSVIYFLLAYSIAVVILIVLVKRGNIKIENIPNQ